VAFYWFTWALVNLALFLLPAATNSVAIWLLGSRLGISAHAAPEQLGYVFAYFSGFAGALLLFFGEFSEPELFPGIEE
jgi:hypothetical protein